MTQLITPKSKVPTLEVPLVGGETFEMSSASPEKFQIVVMYRGLHCPKCKDQLQNIDPQVEDLKDKGYEVVAISMDEEARARKARTDWGLKHLKVGYDLPLLTAKAYGLFISDGISDKEPKIFSEPGLFVVRPDGTLYAEYIQNTPFGRPPLEDIISGLEFVVKNDYPTRGTSVS